MSENTGRWSSEEHKVFIKGLELHGKEWKKIADMVGSRTVVQIRTHAQKYFQKLSKAGKPFRWKPPKKRSDKSGKRSRSVSVDLASKRQKAQYGLSDKQMGSPSSMRIVFRSKKKNAEEEGDEADSASVSMDAATDDDSDSGTDSDSSGNDEAMRIRVSQAAAARVGRLVSSPYAEDENAGVPSDDEGDGRLMLSPIAAPAPESHSRIIHGATDLTPTSRPTDGAFSSIGDALRAVEREKAAAGKVTKAEDLDQLIHRDLGGWLSDESGSLSGQSMHSDTAHDAAKTSQIRITPTNASSATGSDPELANGSAAATATDHRPEPTLTIEA